jgi:hypothetical protein
MQLAQTTDPLYNSYTYPVYRVKAQHYILRNTITNKETEYDDRDTALGESARLEFERRQTLKAASDRVAEIIKRNKK